MVPDVFRAAGGADVVPAEINANLAMGAGVDNGDGTVTFSEHTAGLVLRFKILNGPVLKDADGKPIMAPA